MLTQQITKSLLTLQVEKKAELPTQTSMAQPTQGSGAFVQGLAVLKNSMTQDAEFTVFGLNPDGLRDTLKKLERKWLPAFRAPDPALQGPGAGASAAPGVRKNRPVQCRASQWRAAPSRCHVQQPALPVGAHSTFSREQARLHKPGFVTMDLTMPVMDGPACLEALRTVLADTRVLVVSALSDCATALKAMTKGAHGFLRKPFSDTQGVESLQELMA